MHGRYADAGMQEMPFSLSRDVGKEEDGEYNEEGDHF